MNFVMPDFMPVMPEIFVLTMACLILVIDLYVKDENRGATYLLSQATLIGAAAISLALYSTETVQTFSGTVVVDPMSTILKIAVYISVIFVFVYSKDYLKARNMFRGEYFVLGLFGVLGMMIMISAHNFLTIYLGLELLSLCMYAMVAMQRDNGTSSEAAMKYFVLGAMASGMLLYGMSMIYGATGSLDLAQVSAAVAQTDNPIVLTFGLVFLIIGVAFKLGAVPFHMWVPDVYHGAPTSVTLYIGTAPKIAAFAMAFRLLVDGLEGLHADWQDILIVLSILSMFIGSIVAIAQTSLKRMLAYSTISHVGFILLGLVTGTEEGYAASMFYVLTYAMMGLAGFGMILLLSRAGYEADNIDDFKGLNKRSPWFALMMMITLFSMAGVPPFVGFWAKLSILQQVVSADLVWLAVLAVISAIIGAYYYLRVIKAMYFDAPEDETPIQAGGDAQIMMSINGLTILALGLFPTSLMTVCINALAN